MLPHVSRSQLRGIGYSGYVCRSCRHQLARHRHPNRNEARQQSVSASPATIAQQHAGAGDWISSLGITDDTSLTLLPPTTAKKSEGRKAINYENGYAKKWRTRRNGAQDRVLASRSSNGDVRSTSQGPVALDKSLVTRTEKLVDVEAGAASKHQTSRTEHVNQHEKALYTRISPGTRAILPSKTKTLQRRRTRGVGPNFVHRPAREPADQDRRLTAQDEETAVLALPSSPIRRVTYDSANRPTTLSAKIREMENRPTWGGFQRPPNLPIPSALSYDSLRVADHVSAQTVVATAGVIETGSWGGGITDFGEPGVEHGHTSTSKPKAMEQKRTSGVLAGLSKGFDTLKRMLSRGEQIPRDPDPVDGTRQNLEHPAGLSRDDVAKFTRLERASIERPAENKRPTAALQTPLQPSARAANDSRDFPSITVRTLKSRANITVGTSMPRGKTVQDESSTSAGFPAAQSAPLAEDGSVGHEVKPMKSALKKSVSRKPRNKPSVALPRGRVPTKPLRNRARRVQKTKSPKKLAGDDKAGRKTRKTASTLKKAPSDQEQTASAVIVERHMSLKEAMENYPLEVATKVNGKKVDGSKSVRSATSSPELGDTDIGDVKSIEPSSLHFDPLDIKQPPVPGLEYGLERVLFNPGVYQLQDPHSRVYNFDPYLQNIMPVVEFDFDALKKYKTSSQDTTLTRLAKEHDRKFIGSTSSMTSTLGQFHYLLSNWRELNLDMLSRSFPIQSATFTNINKAPNAIFLRWQDGTYAIDADKEFDSGNVLMLLGKSMELLLTKPKDEYERYRKSDPRQISEQERLEPESYQYTTMGRFLMRSQLDAHDPRLPGTGMFDLKTRAVVSVRMQTDDYIGMTGYQIHTLQGKYESYEREYYDMLRSTMLKYMLQARIGRMDGIFVAYHNVERIFGFQYLSIADMDRALHGQVQPELGDQEFRVSVALLEEILEMATQKFPEKSLRLHFETQPPSADPAHMVIFAEPMEEETIERIQDKPKAKIAEFERTMMGLDQNNNPAHEGAKDANTPSIDVITSAVDGVGAGDSATSPEPTVDYISTTSDADPSFISQIQGSKEQTYKPLFMATVLPYSYVRPRDGGARRVKDPEEGWVACENNRPENLKPDQEWKVVYIMKESTADAEVAWARYEDVKSRRREAFERYRAEENDGNEDKEAKVNYYIRYLRGLSEKGREFRGRIDELEKDRDKVVLGVR